MRALIILTAVAMLTSLMPMSMANYTSTGFDDAFLVSPSESADDPSVGEDLFERGTAEDGCTDYDPTGDVDELDAALAADGFCGTLIYHEGNPDYEQTSTADQDIHVDGITFDAIRVSRFGSLGIGYCMPWCEGLPTYPVMKDEVWPALHAAAPDIFSAETFDPDYQISHALLVPNAATVLSETTGAWSGNGFMLPVWDQTEIAFLSDAAGPIDDVKLETMVRDLKAAGQLGPGATASVCGFNADQKTQIGAAQVSFCETQFEWIDESQDPDTDFGPTGDSPCESPAYMCGTLTPAWYAVGYCSFAASVCIDHEAYRVNYPILGGGATLLERGGYDTLTDYDVMHYVVAPSPSACNTAQEPGFDFDPGTPIPYIAHDLDVFTPFGEVVGLEDIEGLREYAEAIVVKTGADSQSTISGTLGPAGDVVNTVVNTVGDSIRRPWLVEPNAAGDTSRSKINEPRTADDPCASLIASSETDDTVDPWVEVVDSKLFREPCTLVSESLACPVDVYGPSADAQDASNRGTAGIFFTEGNVGVFTDKNDDGDYDAASSNQVFADIETVGAYPMMWDLRLKDANTVDHDTCKNGFATTSLSQQMDEAGYGLHTGLIQVWYLAEPTVMHDYTTAATNAYVDGDAAYVFMSQSLHVLRRAGDAEVQNAVDNALSRLPVTPSQVIYPADDMGLETDFYDGCDRETGGFTHGYGILHSCELGCEGDTIVTNYMFEVGPSGTLGGDDIPAFEPNGAPYQFGEGIHQWIDVDPIDGDTSRTQPSTPPPTN